MIRGRRIFGRHAGRLAALLLAATPACRGDDDDSADVLSGACEAGQARCVDEQSLQFCDDGQWSGAQPCEPQGDGIAVVPTWCQDGGFCTP